MAAAFVLAWTLTSALQASVPVWTDIVSRIEKGVSTSDTAALRAAIAEAEKLADITGQDRERELALLGAAYSGWRLSTTAGLTPAESSIVLKDAEKDLKALLKTNPRSGEAYALLASIYGQMIRFSNGRDKMTLGPEAEANRAEAMKLEPNNPRVVLQSAMSLYNTPAQYGGGPEKAEAGLRQAIALLEREPAGRPWPNWGRFDAHAWLGQALAARGDKAGARTEYNLALAAWPQSGWVKFVLIPALDK
jgi:tetratricopeptide (TPR) repeat protein